MKSYTAYFQYGKEIDITSENRDDAISHAEYIYPYSPLVDLIENKTEEHEH